MEQVDLQRMSETRVLTASKYGFCFNNETGSTKGSVTRPMIPHAVAGVVPTHLFSNLTTTVPEKRFLFRGHGDCDRVLVLLTEISHLGRKFQTVEKTKSTMRATAKHEVMAKGCKCCYKTITDDWKIVEAVSNRGKSAISPIEDILRWLTNSV